MNTSLARCGLQLGGLAAVVLALLTAPPGAGADVRAPATAAASDAKRSDAGSGLELAATRNIAFDTERVSWLSLDLSPDGGSLVLEVLGDLYLLDSAGGRARPLTTGMAFDSQPAYSPDGAMIAFVSDRDGAENVWIMAADGSSPHRLSDNTDSAEFASPAWAPDGSHVIVSRTTWGLRTFEVWAYHVDGGKGVRLTRAKDRGDTPREQRGNALGAVYGPQGRYLYYAYKKGGFAYNAQLPMWQIVRHDLRTGATDAITQTQGSAFRPRLSPDGSRLVYGTRYQQGTGLRIRNLDSGEDRWLVYPVEHDEQESRFTRDLLPGYAFTPDGSAVLVARDGGISRVDVATGALTPVPLQVHVEQALGAPLQFPYRLAQGPVKARMIRDPVLSPDGATVAFSAFTRIHVFDVASRKVRAVSPQGVQAFHPAFSADGRWLAYVSWHASSGGHIWRLRANGRGTPRRLTSVPGYYTDPAFSPDGERLVALRASGYDRLYREFDFGEPIGSDVVWLPAGGGPVSLVMPSRGYGRPHFGPEDDRIYLYQTEPNGTGLISVRFDGTDRRDLLSVKGPGVYIDEDDVAAEEIRVSSDGRHALIEHANQLYLAALLNPNLQNLEVSLAKPSVPLARLTDVGVDFFGWGPDEQIVWSTGDRLYRRLLASVTFEPGVKDKDADDGGGGDSAAAGGDAAADDADRGLREADPSVTEVEIPVYLPRAVPHGVIALEGATVLPMDDAQTVIHDAVVLVENDRISAVGPRDSVTIPPDAVHQDVSGLYVLPGFIDTHAHFRPLRRVLDTSNWAFLANLAYGVTTGIDVQPSTTDALAYQDLIDAGLMLGPRALSTGPGIFSNNDFKSLRHTRAVLERYRDAYRVHNLKSYLVGNRKQRQWIVEAARELELMPTTEGALDMKLDLTHVIDGFSGNEHNFPLLRLEPDVVELVARSGISYTPTLLVSYGGPFAESYFYTRESPYLDAKLRRFTPGNMIDARTLRGPWFREEEYVFPEVAAQAARIVRAGGKVGVGAHGQLQGLGYHWEMWALARGLSNWEVLTAATRHGAEMIGIAEDVGSIAPGKLADLVLLEADPLDDIRNTSRIRYVMKNGELFDADSLDEFYPETRPLPDQWWWNEAPPTP